LAGTATIAKFFIDVFVFAAKEHKERRENSFVFYAFFCGYRLWTGAPGKERPVYTLRFCNSPIKMGNLTRFRPRLRVYFLTQKKCAGTD
jgi:hypothetical protein